MGIFLLCFLYPPTSFTHNSSYQSTIISLPDIVSIHLGLIVIDESSIEPYLPYEIVIVKIAN